MQCPLSPWTLSSLCGLPGLCPQYPWTLSTLSTESVSSLCGLLELCPQYPWTLSRPSTDSMSRDSMDNIQGVHGFNGHFTDGLDQEYKLKIKKLHVRKIFNLKL